jgi:hypothetical protein
VRVVLGVAETLRVRDCACQRHPVHGSLRRTVGGLPDLTIECGDRRGENDGSPVAVGDVVLGHPCRREAKHVVASDEVGAHDRREAVDVSGRSFLVEDSQAIAAPSGAVDDRAQPAPAFGKVQRGVQSRGVEDVGRCEPRVVTERRGDGLAV